MKNMAHIVEGKVVAVSLWDGISPWETDEQVVEIPVIEYTDNITGQTKTRLSGGIGWDYIDGEFIDNRPTPVGDNEGLTLEEREG